MTGRAAERLIPADEEARLEALHRLELLDTEREKRFDDLIAELARKLDVPIAYLALIAEDRQWLKTKVGPLPTQVKREDAFCSRTILQDEPLLVADATTDPRFSDNPMVSGAPHLRFYAGVPISTTSGHTVGTVCVAAPTPREMSPRDLAILQGFAERLQQEINARPAALLAYASEDELLISRFIASHPRLDDPGVLDLWSSRRAESGDTRVWKLKDALWRSRSATLMVSPAFLRSPFVDGAVLDHLLRARELDEFDTRVVLLEPCDRSEVEWLARRPPWPANEQAITIGSDAEIDQCFRDLATELVGEPPAGDAEAVAAPRGRDVQVFLSHAGEDAVAVKELATRLRQAGVDVWLDVDELQPGDDWMHALEEALDQSDAFAVYIGRSGIARWIGREVRVALDRNAKDPHYRFIPILGPGADPEALPRFVAQHHWLDLRDGGLEPAEIRKLVGSILSRPAEAVSLLPPGESPFRGLLTFGVEHAHLFFGRDRETRDLVERLRTSPFLAVIGDSGSGKSSLVRAGLVPALHRGHLRDAADQSAPWRVAIFKPGSDPFRELGNALLELAGELGPAERMSTLEACSRQLEKGTAGLCNAITALVPRGERTLLVVDQFEEVFTQSPDPDERDRFIDTLLEACSGEGDRPLYTIVTLRADFYSRCFEHPTLPEVLSTSQFPLRAIAPEQLAEVIQKPAAMAGLELEPGLVEAILFDIGEGPGNLPLLEHTLLQLWKRRVGETLTHACYEEIGRVQGALEHHAEEVFGSFDEQEKLVARTLLLGLVVPTEGAGPARRRAPIAEVLPADDRRPAAEAVLRQLVDERLVMVRGAGGTEGRQGGEAAEDGEPAEAADGREVEVTHEALLRGWNRLRGWLEEDREFLFWRQRTSAAFAAWEESGHDAGALLRGAPLAEATRWLEERGEDLSANGRAFIRSSLALRTRRHRVRLAAVAAIALSAVVALAFAWIATRERRAAEKSLLLATTAVDEMLTQVGSEALEDVPQLEEIRRELLERARVLYEQLGEQASTAPGLRLQTALAPARIAEIHRQLDQQEAARRELESAVRKLESLAGSEPRDPRFRLELAKVHNEMGRVQVASDPATAVVHYGEAIDLQGALARDLPDEPEYAYELARSHLNRGIAHDALGQSDQAEADFSAAIEFVEPFLDRPGDWRELIRQQVARSSHQLAVLLAGQRKRTEAADQYRRAAALFEALTVDHPTRREYRFELGKVSKNLAYQLSRIDELEEAELHVRRAVGLFVDLADALPEIRSEWGHARHVEGLIMEKLDRRNQAVLAQEEASRIFADLLGDYPGAEQTNDVIREAAFRDAVTLLYLCKLRVASGELGAARPVREELERLLSRLPADRQDQLEGSKLYTDCQLAT